MIGLVRNGFIATDEVKQQTCNGVTSKYPCLMDTLTISPKTELPNPWAFLQASVGLNPLPLYGNSIPVVSGNPSSVAVVIHISFLTLFAFS
jgi:hypothetical protein